MLYITMISRASKMVLSASIVMTLDVIMLEMGALISIHFATAFKVISDLVTIPKRLSPSITIARSVLFLPNLIAVWQIVVSAVTIAKS